jgi:hypothetical protein
MVTLYDLPTWFLVVSMFFPRLALFIEWYIETGHHFPFPQPFAGAAWFFVPRIMILVMIATVMGIGTWFWIHLVVAVIVFLGSAKGGAND